MSNRALLEEMKAQRKVTIEEITGRIKDTQAQRRLIVAELRNKGPSTIGDLQASTGLAAKRILRHLIAMKKFGEVSEVGEKDRGYVYALRKGR